MKRVTKILISLILVTLFSCVTLFHFVIPVHAEDFQTDIYQWYAIQYFLNNGGSYVTENNSNNVSLTGSSTVDETVTITNVRWSETDNNNTASFHGALSGINYTTSQITCSPNPMTTSNSENQSFVHAEYACRFNSSAAAGESMNNITLTIPNGSGNITGSETITGKITHTITGTIGSSDKNRFILPTLKNYSADNNSYVYLMGGMDYYLVFGINSTTVINNPWWLGSSRPTVIRLQSLSNMQFYAIKIDKSMVTSNGYYSLAPTAGSNWVTAFENNKYYPLFFGTEYQMNENIRNLVFSAAGQESIDNAANTNNSLVNSTNEMENLENGYRSDLNSAISNINFGNTSPARYNLQSSMRWVSSTFQRCLIPPFNYLLRYSLILGLTGLVIGKLRN